MNSIPQTVAPESVQPVKDLLEPKPGSQVEELVLDNGAFVTIYPVKLIHIVSLQNLSGMEGAVRLVQLCARFDDKKLTVDELMELGGSDFLRVHAAINKTLKVT
jgi:hypothetical protein